MARPSPLASSSDAPGNREAFEREVVITAGKLLKNLTTPAACAFRSIMQSSKTRTPSTPPRAPYQTRLTAVRAATSTAKSQHRMMALHSGSIPAVKGNRQCEQSTGGQRGSAGQHYRQIRDTCFVGTIFLYSIPSRLMCHIQVETSSTQSKANTRPLCGS